jgi:uncharacterized membrane protein YfcA
MPDALSLPLAALAGSSWVHLPVWALVALGGTALVAGVVRGFAGFGAGLVMVPAFAMIVGPADAVPLEVFLELLALARLLPEALPRVEARTVLAPGIAACLLIPVGSIALVAVEPDLLTRLMSLLVLAFVALLASGWRRRRRPGTATLLGVGALSGTLTGAAGIGGPPMVVTLMAGPDEAAGNRANLIGYFGLTQSAALAIFAWRGLFGLSHLVFGLLLGVPFFSGLHLGARLFRGLPWSGAERTYRGVVLVLLVAIALAGLVAGS